MVPRHARLEWRLSMNHPSQIRMTKPANAPLRVFRHSGFGFLSSFVIQRFVQVRFMVPMHAENERRLSMNRPTPNPSREESERSSAPCQFPSWEGLGVGSWSQCMAKNESRLSRNRKVGQASRLPYVRPASVRGPNARSKDSGGSP